MDDVENSECTKLCRVSIVGLFLVPWNYVIYFC